MRKYGICEVHIQFIEANYLEVFMYFFHIISLLQFPQFCLDCGTVVQCNGSSALDPAKNRLFARSLQLNAAYLEVLLYHFSLEFPQFCLDCGTAVQCSGSSALQHQPRQQTTRCCKQTFAYYQKRAMFLSISCFKSRI